MLDNNINEGSNPKSISFLQNSLDYISFANAYDMPSLNPTDPESNIISQLPMFNTPLTQDDLYVPFKDAISITQNLDMEHFASNNLFSLNSF
jgi:hypothetical protein